MNIIKENKTSRLYFSLHLVLELSFIHSEQSVIETCKTLEREGQDKQGITVYGGLKKGHRELLFSQEAEMELYLMAVGTPSTSLPPYFHPSFSPPTLSFFLYYLLIPINLES